MADSKKKMDKVLEHQLTVLAFQWLKMHPELESVTFRVNPKDKKSLDTEKKLLKKGG